MENLGGPLLFTLPLFTLVAAIIVIVHYIAYIARVLMVLGAIGAILGAFASAQVAKENERTPDAPCHVVMHGLRAQTMCDKDHWMLR